MRQEHALAVGSGAETSDAAAVVDAVIRARKAVRGFLGTRIGLRTVNEILELARHAPSNSNLQPWRVYVLAGASKNALSRAICAAHERCPDAHQFGYKHVPDLLPGVFDARKRDFGERYYGLLGIAAADAVARHSQTGKNFLFFGAPVGFIFTIDETLERGSWLDYGTFLQNIMLAAKARGLDTCPQVSFAKYHTIVRRQLPVPAREIVVCGMSLGYADPGARVNALEIPREPVERFASFHGFD